MYYFNRSLFYRLDFLFQSLNFIDKSLDLLKDVVIDDQKLIHHFDRDNFDDYTQYSNDNYERLIELYYTNILSYYEIFISDIAHVLKVEDYIKTNHKPLLKIVLKELEIYEVYKERFERIMNQFYEIRHAILHRDNILIKPVDDIKGIVVQTTEGVSFVKSMSEETLDMCSDYVQKIAEFVESHLQENKNKTLNN